MIIKRRMLLAGLAVIGMVATGAAFTALATGNAQTAASVRAIYAAYPMPHAEYGDQKVIYHVVQRGSWHNRASEAWRLVHVLNNHINAVMPDNAELRVIFQGDGIDALLHAKKDAALGRAFDQLKAQGVRFHICMNTAIAQRVTPEAMHDVTPADFIQASVAEVVRLQRQGFSYIRF